MNGYLVVFRHSCDDIPLLLTSDKEEARRVALAVTEDGGEDEKKILRIDASTPCNVSVYEFRDGRLVDWEIVNTFEDE